MQNLTETEAKWLEVLKAKSEGKTIEFMDMSNDWYEHTNNKMSITAYNVNKVRIKPEHKYIPFTFEDIYLFKDKWIRIKGCYPLYRINAITSEKIHFGTNELFNFLDAFDNITFEDGTPFGKISE